MIAGAAPLFHAIEKGRTSEAISIIEQGADLEALYDGATPLLRAIILSKFEIALTLIRKDANIEALYRGMTPLQCAIGAIGSESVAIALIEKGANLEVKFNGMTPLQRAILQNDSTVAVALINKGANTETPYEDKTPLQRVIRRGISQVIIERVNDDVVLCGSAIFRETKVALALINKNCVASMDDLFQVLYLTQVDGHSHDIKVLLERLSQAKIPGTINPGDIGRYVENVKMAYHHKLYNLVDALLTHKAIASQFCGQPDPKDPIKREIYRRGVSCDLHRAMIVEDAMRRAIGHCEHITKEISKRAEVFPFLHGKTDYYLTHALNGYRQSYRKIREAKQAAQQESCAAPAAPLLG